MQFKDTDVAIIGAGTAGLAAYRTVKTAGRRALLIEGGPYGTTCARVGCMPSKLLIAAAEAAHASSRLAAFGIRPAGPIAVDGKAVMDRIKAERDRFAGFVVDDVEAFPAADKVRGHARFIDDHTLQIGDALTVRAPRIVIATGSSPSHSPAWDSLGDKLIVNDDVFQWQDLPGSVAVFGPGVIGLEIGQALHRLGVRIRVFGRGGGVGPLSDPALVDSGRRIFGAEFYLDTNAHAEVARHGNLISIRYRALDGSIATETFDFLLAATGRRPNVAGLALDRTSLALDAQGVPLFDRRTLQCGRSSIFIAGDVDNELALLHEAADEGRIAGDNAARYPDVRPGLRRAGLAVVFTDPQIAIVGGGWRDAQATPHVAGEVSFHNQGRSRVMLRNSGLLHVYAAIEDGAFLGAEMIGPDAEHIGHLLAWALQMKLTVQQMLDMPFYHPVIEEGVRTALRDARSKLAAAQAERRAA
ncbi:MAG: dihydrolipoyl dehydrogenase [Casimicrobiaceae bacterium]